MAPGQTAQEGKRENVALDSLLVDRPLPTGAEAGAAEDATADAPTTRTPSGECATAAAGTLCGWFLVLSLLVRPWTTRAGIGRLSQGPDSAVCRVVGYRA